MPTPNDDDLKKDQQDSSPSDDDALDTDTLDTDTTDTEDQDTDTVPGKKSAEARINELTAELRTTQEELRTVKEATQRIPTPPATDKPVTPEVQKAVGALRDLKFVQQEDVDRKIQEIEDRLALNTAHQGLENSYDGSDGRPKYDRHAVEDYMKKNGVYNPEVAYKAMHETELLDWALKKAEGSTKKRPYVERPGSPGSNREDQTITRDKIAEAMKTPAGREWYEQNRDKILELTAKGQL